MKVKNKKITFAYEEYHPEDGPFCWNEEMHEHHGWQEKENKRIIDIPMIMPNGTIEHFYMAVAKEVPDTIVWEMINKAVEDVRKGMESWQDW